MKHPIGNHFPLETAETIALQALAFLASDPARLSNFTALSGISLEDLHQRASDPEVLAGALDALLRDESTLLMFCANTAIKPEDLPKAAGAIESTIEGHNLRAKRTED